MLWCSGALVDITSPFAFRLSSSLLLFFPHEISIFTYYPSPLPVSTSIHRFSIDLLSLLSSQHLIDVNFIMSASPETPSKKAYSSHYADLKLQNTPLMQFQKFHQHDPSPASTFANTISTKSFPPTPNEAGQNCKAYPSTALSSIIIRSSRVSFFMPYINILQWSMYQTHI